jgi:hypothetical protein
MRFSCQIFIALIIPPVADEIKLWNDILGGEWIV